jgi:ankyrin repeat protein
LILSITSDLEYRDKNGETALHWATMKGSFTIFELLLKKYKNLQKVPDPKNIVNFHYYRIVDYFLN